MDEAPWYALYTRPRHEKKLAADLNQNGIEAYVPMRRVLKQWSDRKKWVEEPLLRSYCFVRTSGQQYFDALNTAGAVRYVWFNGRAATIPDRQINVLKALVGSDLEIDAVTCDIKPGARVKVTAGPLIGVIGELVSMSGQKKVILRIDHLDTVLTVTISPLLLEKVPDPPPEERKEGERRYKRFW